MWRRRTLRHGTKSEEQELGQRLADLATSAHALAVSVRTGSQPDDGRQSSQYALLCQIGRSTVRTHLTQV